MNTQRIKSKRYALYFIAGQHICPGCGKHKTYPEMTLDHIFPKSKGGGLSWTNVRLMCAPCNESKADTVGVYA